MRKVDIGLIIILLAILGCMVYGIYRLQQDSSQCTVNPVGMAMRNLKKNFGENISCSCLTDDWKTITLREENIEVLDSGKWFP